MPRGRYPRTGTVLLGKYRVESIIGEGGMGGVLKAWHIDLDEAVAIKVLLPDMLERDEIVQRFMREAKAAVKLKGEHVARVLDVGRLEGDAEGNLEGVPYIVMEYLDGADLNAIIKHHGPQDPQMAVDLMLQACEAIAEAHSLGIIHRDIKASNFFITQPEGQPPLLKVLDFGIATTPKGTSELTDGGSIIGTPSYMAPEQMRSSRLADARSDIWSLGVVLYEMLEGARPFRSEAYSDLCLKVGMDPPEPMVQPDTPDALKGIVMKCLEKAVERRYQSVAELAFDLLPFASDPVLARASVEQTARLLSRRATRAVDASRAPDDLTPAPGALAVPRLTPGPISSQTPGGGVPIMRSTPTSVRESVGEVQGNPSSVSTSRSQAQVRPRPQPRRSVVVITSFVVAIALAGGGVLLFGGSRSTRPASSGAESPPNAPVTMQPTLAEPPARTDVDTGTTTPGSAAGSAASSAAAPPEPMTASSAGSGSAVTTPASPPVPPKTAPTSKVNRLPKKPPGKPPAPRKQDDPFSRR